MGFRKKFGGIREEFGEQKRNGGKRRIFVEIGVKMVKIRRYLRGNAGMAMVNLRDKECVKENEEYGGDLN